MLVRLLGSEVIQRPHVLRGDGKQSSVWTGVRRGAECSGFNIKKGRGTKKKIAKIAGLILKIQPHKLNSVR